MKAIGRSMSEARRSRLVPRITRADGSGLRIDVAGGAVVVTLGVVRIGLLVRLHIGATAVRVALHRVASSRQASNSTFVLLDSAATSDNGLRTEERC
jgi:hypothetical protein